MKRLWCAVSLVLALSACANPQLEDYSRWVQSARERAEHGEIKWSEYYQGCFARLVDVHDGVSGKLAELDYYNELIDYSLAYEAGRLGKAEFDQKRRAVQLAHVRHEDELRHKYTQPGARADTAGDIYPH
jgi:hypothetical protein